MATPVIMPRQGQSVESCIIGQWHKQKGDKISVGDILFTYETDKATFDEESKVEGTLLELFFEEGDDVPCLTNVCAIGNEGEDVSEFNPNKGAPAESDSTEPAAKTEEKTETAPQAAATVTPVARDSGEMIKVSPRARNLADRAGVDVASTPATGPAGRVIERDVRAMIDNNMFATPAAKAGYQAGMTGTGIGGRVTTADLTSAPAAYAAAPVADGPEFEEVPHTNIRKAIARSMHNSLSTMAQLTLNSSFDMTEVNAFRKKLKAAGEKMDLPKITINDIILFAVSRTLLKHSLVNAHYLDDKMLLFKRAHVGMAVDTPRGLMVPTIFNADSLSLQDISKTARSLADACSGGSLSPDLMQGGTFTVTNLGTLGIESFTPVINPPQTCILGVNTIETKVKAVGGEVKPYQAMTLSLTFDHRALDGAPAARFLKDLVNYLENFSIMSIL